jgi:hypothetical protein
LQQYFISFWLQRKGLQPETMDHIHNTSFSS